MLFTNKIKVKVTASTHAGIFRITFPPHVLPAIMIGNGGNIVLLSSHIVRADMSNTLLYFDKAVTEIERIAGAYIIQFVPAESGETIINVQLSSSSVCYEGA